MEWIQYLPVIVLGAWFGSIFIVGMTCFIINRIKYSVKSDSDFCRKYDILTDDDFQKQFSKIKWCGYRWDLFLDWHIMVLEHMNYNFKDVKKLKCKHCDFTVVKVVYDEGHIIYLDFSGSFCERCDSEKARYEKLVKVERSEDVFYKKN